MTTSESYKRMAAKGKPKCVKGTACGYSCINGKYTCSDKILKRDADALLAVTGAKTAEPANSVASLKSTQDRSSIRDRVSAEDVSKAEAHLKRVLSTSTVGVNVPSKVLDSILVSGRLKSQFETNTSSATLDKSFRAEAEEAKFGYSKSTKAADRIIYGSVFAGPDDNASGQYGDVIIELKPSVRSRTTVTAGDSLDATGGKPVAVDDPKIEMFPQDPARYKTDWAKEISDSRFFELNTPGSYSENLDDEPRMTRHYWEAQVHGGVSVSDIARVHVPGTTSESTLAKLSELGIPYAILEKPPTTIPKAKQKL